MKMVYERDRVDNKFKDLRNGELFKCANGKYSGRIFMKCACLRTECIAVDVDDGLLTNLFSEDEEIVRVEGVLTIK